MMKKLSIIACMACALMVASCEMDDTLDETRVTDIEIPSISLDNVEVIKYDAAFSASLSNMGNPAVRECGILISQESQPSMDNSTILTADEVTSSINIKKTFSPGTTYYACAYALTANKLITSEVKSFTTASHPLSAFIGKKTLNGYSLYQSAYNSIDITLSPDANDESVLYLNGLSSEAGVSLVLGQIKLVFDLDNNKVTIPNNQIVEEKNYGAYRYVMLDDETNPVAGDNVGSIEDGAIYFDSLGALIVQGGNGGLFHWAYYEVAIQ